MDIKIAALIGGRAFIGDPWTAFLHALNIPFNPRLRETQYGQFDACAGSRAVGNKVPRSAAEFRVRLNPKPGSCWIASVDDSLGEC
jgi:hypothetical protein